MNLLGKSLQTEGKSDEVSLDTDSKVVHRTYLFMAVITIECLPTCDLTSANAVVWMKPVKMPLLTCCSSTCLEENLSV